MGRFRTLASRQRPSQVGFSIGTLPVDEDPFAMAMARQLSAWFRTAGIDATTQPMTAEELYRQTLVNHEFDAFLGQFPYRNVHPDSLYSLLHSRFTTEPGWQNPFGYSNLTVDDLLSRQRHAPPGEQTGVTADVQRRLAETCPFIVLGFPDVVRTARTDRFRGWATAFGQSPLGLLALDRADPAATTLRLTTIDSRPTTNLNPLVAPFRGRGRVTALVYDSLARRSRGRLSPWAAEDWEWIERRDDQSVLRLTLRDQAMWHDGEPLTASDVAFTYRFLRDTSLGTLERSVPPMRFRGRSSLVDSVRAVDEETVDLSFDDVRPTVATRALTVPLLPEHVWRPRTHEADIGGFDVGMPTTEALVTDAIPPVGSGLLRFEAATNRESLRLRRFADHFVERDVALPFSEAVSDGSAFEELRLQFVGSDSTAVDLVRTGEADATLLGVGTDLVRTIGRAEALTLLLDRTDAFYVLGFNVRRAPFANPRFRRLLARLLDRHTLDEQAFGGYLNPAVSPLAGSRPVPDDVAWDGGDPVAPFLGTDGRLDERAVREAFSAAGYRFDEQGNLLEA